MFVMFPLMPWKFLFFYFKKGGTLHDFTAHFCIANIVFEDERY